MSLPLEPTMNSRKGPGLSLATSHRSGSPIPGRPATRRGPETRGAHGAPPLSRRIGRIVILGPIFFRDATRTIGRGWMAEGR